MRLPKKGLDFGKLVVEPPFGPPYFVLLQSEKASIGHGRTNDVVLLDVRVPDEAGLLTVSSKALLLSKEAETQLRTENDSSEQEEEEEDEGEDVFLDATRSSFLGRTRLKYWPAGHEETQEEKAILPFSQVARFPDFALPSDDDDDKHEGVFNSFATPPISKSSARRKRAVVQKEVLLEAKGALKAELKATTEKVSIKVTSGLLVVTPMEKIEDAKSVQTKRVQPRLLALNVISSEPMSASWEGAVLFVDTSCFEKDAEDASFEKGAGGVEKSLRFSGDVVEVDADEEKLYVLLHPVSEDEFASLQSRNFKGKGTIQPFAFLKNLVDLYHDDDEITETRLKMALQNTQLSWWNKSENPNESAPKSDVEGLISWLKEHSWALLWGPPGTGKTTSVAVLVANLLAFPEERILVVSTTNRATDGIALAIGKAVQKKWPGAHLDESVARVGRGAKASRFKAASLDDLISKNLISSHEDLALLEERHEAAADSNLKAQLAQELRKHRMRFQDRARLFYAPQCRVVIATAHRATRLIAKDIESQRRRGQAPFSLVIVDEAGLLSRAHTAALSLLSSRGVLLVGDPKQLAPIAALTRLLPSAQMRWLSQSALEDLDAKEPPPHCYLLQKQFRMHKTIGEVVSKYQYEGLLQHAEKNGQTELNWDILLRASPRAIWVVLDEQKENRGRFFAKRGVQNVSWERPAAVDFLKVLFESHPRLEKMNGLFLSPFVAQVKTVKKWLTTENRSTWHCSSVHQQQGAEADVVIFDMVNAASNGFSHFEWKRLINVAMSRARCRFFLLASKQEMTQPHTRSLARLLPPQVLRGRGERARWEEVSFVHPEEMKSNFDDDKAILSADKSQATRGVQLRDDTPSLGTQLAALERRNPILSAEQHALCNLQLDHKPRLVRGVPGSGKTVVLAHWLAKTLLHDNVKDVWVVFGNRTLEDLLKKTAADAFSALGGKDFPAERVHWQHIGELLRRAEQQLGSPTPKGPDFYQYDQRSADLLATKSKSDDDSIPFRAKVLFVDEAQDLGPHTLHLLCQMVEQRDANDPNSRAMLVFYDNAQDLYRRGRPNWTKMGLNLQGRSRVMKVSHRSTQPILEFAFNVRARLCDLDKDEDLLEQIKMDLVQKQMRNGRIFWHLRYSDIQGPAPTFQLFPTRAQEFSTLATHLKRLLTQEHILETQIVVIALFRKMHADIAAALAQQNVSSTSEMRPSPGVLICTPHAFKGHEAEFVFVVAADCFTAPFEAPNEASEAQRQQGWLFSAPVLDVKVKKEDQIVKHPSDQKVEADSIADGRQILAASLYVALTRARSLLCVSATQPHEASKKHIVKVLAQVKDDLRAGDGLNDDRSTF